MADRGQFLIARPLDPNTNFYVTKKSFLGEVELAEYLDMPGRTDESGKQRNVVAFQLRYSDQSGKIIPNTVVELIPGDCIHFPEPWIEMPGFSTDFERGLEKEVSSSHFLYGKNVKAIGKRIDNDDVLFNAVVHLTWKSKKEEDATYPVATLYGTWVDLYNHRIVPDHDAFTSNQ